MVLFKLPQIVGARLLRQLFFYQNRKMTISSQLLLNGNYQTERPLENSAVYLLTM